jgi:hypothetical protein
VKNPKLEKPKATARQRALYNALIVRLFEKHFRPGLKSFEFDSKAIEETASELKLRLPKNFGDFICSFRYPRQTPVSFSTTAARAKEWTIEAAGLSRYRFRQSSGGRILANPHFRAIKIPDATPKLICAYALSDAQALLAKVRFNRLIDIFLGLTAYSLQSRFRTAVKGIGPIEIDEVYIGVNQNGEQFIIPVQAKGEKGTLAAAHTRQDIECCEQNFPKLTCRAISTQFLEGDTVAMFELEMEDGEVKVVVERHYRLVAAEEIGEADLKSYAKRT